MSGGLREPGDLALNEYASYVTAYRHVALACEAVEAAADVIEDGGVPDMATVECCVGVDVLGFCDMLRLWCPELDMVRASYYELTGSVRLGVAGRALLPSLDAAWRRLNVFVNRVHVANPGWYGRLSFEHEDAIAGFTID